MSDHTHGSEKKTFKQVLSVFLANNRIPLLVIAAVIFVGLLGTGIYTTVHQKRIEKSAVAAENLQELFDEWQSADEADKSEIEEQLLTDAEAALEDFSGMYAAQRARMLRGRLFFAQDEWEKAVDDFEALAQKFPNSYLAPMALMSAAVAYEHMEEYDSAISLYQRVRDEYADSFPNVSYALFSIGRLYEKTENESAAIEAYNEIIDNFSQSNWTNLARDRIIYLEAMN